MLFLASGSIGSAADATIITQNFNFTATALDITSTGAQLVTVVGPDTKYTTYPVYTETNGSGKKSMPVVKTRWYFHNLMQSDGTYAQSTGFSSDSRIGTPSDYYSSKDSAELPMAYPFGWAEGPVIYSQLKFDLDGVTTYGVVGIQNAAFRSISYEVPDAVAPVPEPAVWAEMIAGLGAAGAVMRRRRRAMRSIAA